VRPTTSVAQTGTARAFSLLQQKQFDAALKEAKKLAAADPKNSDAWKIAGFAELELKQYNEAASDLERALALQRAAGEADPNTSDALIRALVRGEQFERALPLLVEATTRKGAAPNANLLYSRGLAEFKTNKLADAERSFSAAVKADPKHAFALYYLGSMAYSRKDMDATIGYLNRATLADAKLGNAWTMLTYAYLNRAQAATGPKADADYLAAVRSSESLLRLTNDAQSIALHGQTLIRAKQYLRAATVLERLANDPAVDGTTLYLLGFAHSRSKNFPKAATALEKAATKTPENIEIYREMGYVYENLKEYAKALAAYERGLQVAPDDANFKESAERIRPFAK
jgi:serine/threonine-protein kinase